MRLSPLYPAWYLNILAFSHYQRGEYDEAEQVARLALQRDPQYSDCRLYLALVAEARGRTEEARREAAELLRRDPGYRLAALQGRLAIVKDRGLAERLLATCRELGLQ